MGNHLARGPLVPRLVYIAGQSTRLGIVPSCQRWSCPWTLRPSRLAIAACAIPGLSAAANPTGRYGLGTMLYVGVNPKIWWPRSTNPGTDRGVGLGHLFRCQTAVGGASGRSFRTPRHRHGAHVGVKTRTNTRAPGEYRKAYHVQRPARGLLLQSPARSVGGECGVPLVAVVHGVHLLNGV